MIVPHWQNCRFPLHEKCRVYVCQKLGRVRRKPKAPVLLSPSPRKATPSCMRLTRTFSGVRVVEHPFPPCSCAENDSIFLNTSVLHFGFFYQFSQTWQEDLLGTLSTSPWIHAWSILQIYLFISCKSCNKSQLLRFRSNPTGLEIQRQLRRWGLATTATLQGLSRGEKPGHWLRFYCSPLFLCLKRRQSWCGHWWDVAICYATSASTEPWRKTKWWAVTTIHEQ